MNGLAKGAFACTSGVIVALAIFAWTPGSDAASAAPPPLVTAQCEATFDPDTIQQGDVHEEVHVHLSESIGEIEDVETPDESDLDVLWVHDDDEEEPQEGRVRLSAIRAEVGEWTLQVIGDTETCEGAITVVEGTF